MVKNMVFHKAWESHPIKYKSTTRGKNQRFRATASVTGMINRTVAYNCTGPIHYLIIFFTIVSLISFPPYTNEGSGRIGMRHKWIQSWMCNWPLFVVSARVQFVEWWRGVEGESLGTVIPQIMQLHEGHWSNNKGSVNTRNSYFTNQEILLKSKLDQQLKYVFFSIGVIMTSIVGHWDQWSSLNKTPLFHGYSGTCSFPRTVLILTVTYWTQPTWLFMREVVLLDLLWRKEMLTANILLSLVVKSTGYP